MLEEDRTSIFAGQADGGTDTFGAKVVGGSLAAVSDPEARRLFGVLAVAPEDVPVPMAALELVWCSGTGMTAPIGRLGMMKLRKHVFALLDRNLLLGETVSGVYMHDVVREFSIGLSTEEQLQG